MADADYVQFLQTYVPRLGLRWQGFRKVSNQVIKRIKRRLKELELEGPAAYAAYLAHHPTEWHTLDEFCRITISRFYRDQDVFDTLRTGILPRLAQLVLDQNQRELRCWCAGCASGEEAYTLSLMWHLCLAPTFPSLQLDIVATDVDPHMLDRARRGQYGMNSLKDLPPGWLRMGFVQLDHFYTVQKRYRKTVSLMQQDIRSAMPDGPFHLIMCRNLVFTYFSDPLQHEMERQLGERLVSAGVLIMGKRECLPPGSETFVAYDGRQSIYQKRISHQSKN